MTLWCWLILVPFIDGPCCPRGFKQDTLSRCCINRAGLLRRLFQMFFISAVSTSILCATVQQVSLCKNGLPVTGQVGSLCTLCWGFAMGALCRDAKERYKWYQLASLQRILQANSLTMAWVGPIYKSLSEFWDNNIISAFLYSCSKFGIEMKLVCIYTGEEGSLEQQLIWKHITVFIQTRRPLGWLVTGKTSGLNNC